MRVLHLADLHLDSPMRGLSAHQDAPDAIASCTRDAFQNAVGFAVDEAVDLVLIAGDAYDGEWNDFSTGVFLARQLGRLRDARIPVVMVWGNHDRASLITDRLSLPDGVRVLALDRPETVVFEQLGVAVHGQSFGAREVPEDLAAAYPPARPDLVNIGLLHTSFAGGVGHDTYAPTSAAVLQRAGYDYWALGHVHMRSQVSRSPVAWYAGCVQGRSVKETGAHGGLLVRLERGEAPVVEEHDFDVLRFVAVTVDCAGESSINGVITRCRAKFAEAVGEADGRSVAARVTLEGATAAHRLLLAREDELVAGLQLAASDVGQDRLWLGRVSVETVEVQTQSAGDSELAGVLDAALADPRTKDELAGVLAELVELLPDAMLDAGASLSWLADSDTAWGRLAEKGRARLEDALGLLDGTDGG
ncbi:MAG: metallophosphoesterase family protein [Solirubrobacteraceae bacterium]